MDTGIRVMVDSRSTAALIDEMGVGTDDIAVVLPALLAKLPSVMAGLTVEPLQARFRLFQSVSSFLRRAAARRLLVLVVEATPVCYGAVDYYLGLLAATLGEASSAHQHLLAATDLHRVWGAEPMLARTLTADAAVLLAAPDPTIHQGASASAMITVSSAERLGMPRVKVKADEIPNAAK
jgi:hypothetical protein